MPKGGDSDDKKGDDLFRDLSSFRKEALKVSDSDQQRWKDEAHRALLGQEPAPSKAPEPAVEKKAPSRWERIQRQERKKQIAIGLLAVCGVVIVLQMNVGSYLRALFTPRPQTPVSVAPPTPVVKPPQPPDTQMLAEAFLVCRWELRWINPRIEFKNIGEDPFRYDWSTLEGAASMFSPTRHTDPLDRYTQVASAAATPHRVQLLGQLAAFIKSAGQPGEQLLAAAFTDDPGAVRERGAALLETADLTWASRVALVTGLAELEAGGDVAKARGYLARAAKEAPPDDPWPSRALALLDVARGKPAEAASFLESRHTAQPGDEFAGYQLVWLLVQTGKTAEVDKVLERLEGLPRGEVARLLRAVSAASRKDWARFEPIAAKLDSDLALRPPTFRARYQALKGQALLSRDPNQSTQAREMLTKSYELDQACTWSDLSLARLFADRKQWAESAGSYRRYLRRFPTWSPARRELANVLATGQYFAQALGEYSELLNSDGPRDEYLKGIQLTAKGLGRPDLARYLLDRSRTVAPR